MTRGNKKVLIIGTGSIGKRHYRIFNDILLCDTYIKSSKVTREKDLKHKGYKVLAVEGIHAHDGKPELDLSYLDSNYEIINTKNNGEFQIDLKPGLYTFFILKNVKAYLNNFDGVGNYSHIEVKDNINNFIIRDYQNAYF